MQKCSIEPGVSGSCPFYDLAQHLNIYIHLFEKKWTYELDRISFVRCFFGREEKYLRCSMGWNLDSLWE
jgi:hypothetical protein